MKGVQKDRPELVEFRRYRKTFGPNLDNSDRILGKALDLTQNTHPLVTLTDHVYDTEYT